MTEVKYNGTTLANLESGDTVVLECTGKTMRGNVEVSASGGEEWDGSYTISGGVATVTIMLTNPISDYYFGSCTIYDSKGGNIIGEIDSADGSTIVETTTGQVYIYLHGNGMNAFINVSNSSVKTTGDVALSGLGNSGFYTDATFTATGDGTITLDGVNYWD